MADDQRSLTVSVVIPTRDRAHGVAAAVTAVLADGATTEVVVVDDGSRDGTGEVLSAIASTDERLRSIRMGGEGSAKAREAGLLAATGDIVVMVDDDVIVGSDTVAGHRDRHSDAADPDLVVVGYMPIRVADRREPGQFATRFYAAEYDRHVEQWEQRRTEILDGLWLGNVSAPRSAWLRVGMVDADFHALNHEDRDLGLRMKQAGLRAVFDRSLTSVHAHQRDLDAFLRDSYRQGVGRHQLARRHGLAAAEESALGHDLPSPVRAVLRVFDHPALRAVLQASLRRIVVVGGRTRLWAVEDAAARALRRLALRRAARDAAGASAPPSRSQ